MMDETEVKPKRDLIRHVSLILCDYLRRGHLLPTYALAIRFEWLDPISLKIDF